MALEIVFGSTGNTFGPSSSQQFPLVDVRCVREHRERFRRDAFPELDRANSYYSMAGRWPDVGWVLLDRAAYNQLNPYSNTMQLVMWDGVNAPIVLPNLSIVQARCVTRGVASDPNAIYLIQLTNNEGILYNPWFQFPVNVQYNVVAPAYPGNTATPTGPTYISGSLTGANGTDAWTWNGMVQDLWNKASALLGPYPGLPIVPNGAPEGFSFVGVPHWEALSRVMDYLGLAISGSFPNFTIVVPGAADAAYQALVTKYANNVEDSMEYLDVGSGRAPSSVVVFFNRRNQVYGTEETVRYSAGQWQNNPAYSVTVAAPATFSRAAGTGYIWSDFRVRVDQEGNVLAADVTQANAIAAERASQFFNTIYRGTQGFARSVYTGALNFTTGSLVDGVRWFNTGKLGYDDPWSGWRTEVIRGYTWEEITFPLTVKGLTGVY